MSTKLKLLMSVAAMVNSSLEPRVIHKNTLEAAALLMDAEAGSLLLIDDDKHQLYFEVAVGEKTDQVEKTSIDIDKGIAGWVVREKVPVIVNDVQADPRFFRNVDSDSGFTTRNIIAAPLLVKGRPLGVLEAVNKRDGDFTEADLELFSSLADMVATAVDNATLHQKLVGTFREITTTLADALEKRDHYTGGHTNRVREYSMAIGVRMGLSGEELDNLLLSSVLHDVGKIGVDDAVLRKNGKLDKGEWMQMMKHTEIGADILKHVRSMSSVIPGVQYHHERIDGVGYPGKLKGEMIPLIARIIAVADAYDAMTSDRPYRKALSVGEAVAELERCRETQFDSDVVSAFVAFLKSRECGSGDGHR